MKIILRIIHFQTVWGELGFMLLPVFIRKQTKTIKAMDFFLETNYDVFGWFFFFIHKHLLSVLSSTVL